MTEPILGPRSVVVLAHAGDAGATGVVSALATRVDPRRVVVVRPADLCRARWSHRVSESGAVSTRLGLPDGRVLHDREVGAVLHRLTYLPLARFATATARDRDYARAELHALVGSWLLGLGTRVLGSVSAYGEASGPVSPLAALAHAGRCGLPVARLGIATRWGLLGPPGAAERQVPRLAWPGARSAPVPVDVVPALPPGETERVLVVGDRMIGRLTGAHGMACRRLGERLGTRLVEVRFAMGEVGPVVVEVLTCPPLDLPEQRAAVAGVLADLAGSALGRAA